MLRTIANAFSVADIRKKLAFTAAMLLLYRLGAFIPSPGVDIDAVREVQSNFGGSQHPRLPQPLLGRQPRTALAVRARDHALHHGLDHPAAAHGGRPLAGEAAERRRGRPAEDHPVHALPDGRPGLRPVLRLRPPLQVLRRRSRQQKPAQQPRRAESPADRDLPDGRLHPADVAGRADHPARDRQRDLADDLRLDRLRPAGRDRSLVDQPRPGLRRDDALRRPRRDRRDRLRPGGPAAHSRSSTRNGWWGGK